MNQIARVSVCAGPFTADFSAYAHQHKTDVPVAIVDRIGL